jgi:Zn-dependent protease with chaperone function
MRSVKVIPIVLAALFFGPLVVLAIWIPLDIAMRRFESGLEVGWLTWVVYIVGVWLMGLALLYLAGTSLSKSTLAAAERTQSMERSVPSRGERLLKWSYRVVIAIASVYFYVSVLVWALVVVSILIVAFLLWANSLSWMYFLSTAAICLYVVYHLVRGILIWVRGNGAFGLLVTREQTPELWMIVEEVAERVGTRHVDALVLTPAAEMLVIENGNVLTKLRNKGERCLIVGLGLLPEMTQIQFKVILAHEYGHFVGRDTIGNVLERHVHFALNRVAGRFAARGLARWYNPVWLFLIVFQRIFLRITLGASRLREILADRCAVRAYGTRNCVDALTHTARQGAAFSTRVSHELGFLLQVTRHASRRWNLQNLYVKPPLTGSLREQFEAKVDKEMTRSTSPYDSHLSNKDRIELIQQLEVADTERNERPAWDLFPEVKELQDLMTGAIQADFARWRERNSIWLPRRRYN